MLEQEALDLGGVGVEAADDEHVLLAADDREPPGLIEGAEISGVQPAVGIDRFRGGHRVVQITLHHGVAPHQHFTVGGDPHLDTVTGLARGGGNIGERVAGARQRDRAGLGQSVSGGQGLERQLLVHPTDEFHRDVGGPGDPGAQGRQPMLVGHRQQRVIQRRRSRQHRDPFGFDQIDHGGHLEHRNRQDGGAPDQRGDASGLVAEGVEERVDDQVPVTLAQVGEIAPLAVEPQCLFVIHHHALGPAGGTGGVDDIGDVRAEQAPRFVGPATAQEVRGDLDRRKALGHAEILSQKTILDQDGLRAAAGDDVGGLFGLEPGIHRHEYAAGGDQAEGRDQPRRRVGGPDRNPITSADPELGERAGGTSNTVRQFDITDPQRPVDDRFGITETVADAADHLRDGLPPGVVGHSRNYVVTRRPRLPPMILAWSSSARCSRAVM